MLGKRHITAHEPDHVTVRCRQCERTEDVPITADQVKVWKDGRKLQDVAPRLQPYQRELIISGMCELCFDRMFAPTVPKVLDLKVNMAYGYANDPQIYVQVDHDDFSRQEWQAFHGGMYIARVDQWMTQLVSDTNNHRGFGGSGFCLKMKDGTHAMLGGPWSSRASCANFYLPEPYDEVIISTGPMKYVTKTLAGWNDGKPFEIVDAGHSLTGGRSLSVNYLQTLLEKYCPHLEMRAYHLYNARNDDEVSWMVHAKEGCLKPAGCQICEYKGGISYEEGVKVCGSRVLRPQA